MIALLLLSILPPQNDGVLRDHVDVIEINHHYDTNGRHLHDQLIFWEWYWDTVIPYRPAEYDACDNLLNEAREEWRGARYHVVDWRLMKGGRKDMLPWRDWPRGGYTCLWDEKGDVREVRAGSIRETWSQIQFEGQKFADPEQYEREFIRYDEQRRHLKPAPPHKPFVHETPAEIPDAH